MSYCRTGSESDIYLIRDMSGYLVCFHERGERAHITRTEQEMIDHLLEHRERGQKVPERALQRLHREKAVS